MSQTEHIAPILHRELAHIKANHVIAAEIERKTESWKRRGYTESAARRVAVGEVERERNAENEGKVAR